MTTLSIMRAAALLLGCAALPAPARQPVSDTPADYSHAIPLAISGKNAVIQLRLPQAVYLHARSPDLRDVRVFDSGGKVVPFAIRPAAERSQASRRAFPVTIFPVPVAAPGTRSDIDIKTSSDGSVTSITAITTSGARPAGAGPGSLVLDLGKSGVAIDALAFTLPEGQSSYHAQVELEVSDDLRAWESLGTSSLSWLVNGDGKALASNRMEFAPRPFRYARLSWRAGTPLQFAAIAAESPTETRAAPALDSIVVAPAPGRFKDDLVYATPPAIPARRVNLQFGERSVVAPAVLGHYVELPAVKGGGTTRWDFRPRMEATFFQLTQDGKRRASGDIIVDGVQESNWVARSAALVRLQPSLQLSWTPDTLVFVDAGPGPYTLHVGRSGAPPARLPIAQVAPGFSEAELQALEMAETGPLLVASMQAAEESEAQRAGAAARKRMFMLWGVLLAGVVVLGAMAWRLIRQMKNDAQ